MNFLRSGMVFWDIGAHIGEFSLLASGQVGAKGRVDAFEPNPQLSDLICRTIEVNRLAKVTVHSRAVTDQSGVAEFVIDPEPSISHMRAPTEETPATSTITVSTLSLGDFHLQCGYGPHLVKIDVEGAELAALEGMAGCLDRDSPDLIVEVTDEYLRAMGASAAALVTFLAGKGYAMYRIDHNALVPVDAAHLHQCPSQFNALFTKRPNPGAA